MMMASRSVYGMIFGYLDKATPMFSLLYQTPYQMPRSKFLLMNHKGSGITTSLMAILQWTKLPSSNPFPSHGWRGQTDCFGHTQAMETTSANRDVNS